MRKKLFVVVLLVFGVEFVVLVDKVISSKWPDQLEVTSGIFSVKAVGRDEYLEVSNERQAILLSCSLGISGTTRCFSEEQLQQLSGKQVVVHWYHQSIYGGVRENKIVSLEENGKQFRDMERTKFLDRSNIRTSAIVGGVCVIGLFFLVL
jgi:hypothetical protein